MLQPKKVIFPVTSLWPIYCGSTKGERIALTLIAFLITSCSSQPSSVHSKHSPNLAEQAQALLSLGQTQWQSGQTAQGLQTLNSALVVSQQLKDPAFEAAALTNRGQLYTVINNTNLALADLNRGLQLREQLGDRSGEAEVLTCIGQTYMSAGQNNQAEPYLKRALVLWPYIKTDSGRAALLNTFGDFLNWSGDRSQALSKLEQAVSLAQADHNRRIEASILNSIGEVWWAKGNAQEAIKFFEKARPVRREVHDKEGEAITLVDIAAYYGSAGDTTADAINYDQQAAAIFREVGDLNSYAVTQNNIGAIYESLGHPDLAFDDYQRARSIEQETRNPDLESITLHAIGAMFHNIAQPRKALDYYQQALALEQQTGNKIAQAGTLNNIAGVDSDLGHPFVALQHYRQALQLQVEDPRAEAMTLHDIGSVYANIKEPQQAIVYYRRALPLEQTAHDQETEAFTRWRLATLDHKDPVSGYLAALAIAQNYPNIEGLIEASLMDEFRREKQPALAIYFGRRAVNSYQRIRENMVTFDDPSRSSFVQSKSQTYRSLAELLASQGRLFEAEQVLNLVKEAEFRETVRGGINDKTSNDSTLLPRNPAAALADSRFDSGTSEGMNLVEANYELSRLERLAQFQKLSATDQVKSEKLRSQIVESKAKIKAFLDAASFAEAPTVYSGNRDINTINSENSNLEKALAKLEPGTIALYTVFGTSKSYIIVISAVSNPSDPDNVKATRQGYEIRATHDRLTKVILDLHDKSQSEVGDLTSELQELSHYLLDPVAADIAAATRLSRDHVPTLIWSLDDLLSCVPVAALYDNTQPPGRRYLIERARNVYITPNSIDYLKEPPSTSPIHAVGFGISNSLEGQKPLTSVDKELDDIIHDPDKKGSSQGVMQGQIFEDPKFNIKTLAESLQKPPRPPVVHIATHFIFQCSPDVNKRCTKESYLLINGDTPGTAFHLTLSDMDNLSFAGTRLVTLAVCDSGEITLRPDGRAIESLSMEVQEKQAQAVLATLWSVFDESTPQLMKDFYQRWTSGQRTQKVDALRQAQLTMLHGYEGEPVRFRQPQYWAPFVLFGNYH